LTVRQVTNYLIEQLRHDSLLDAADAMLYLEQGDPGMCESLDELLLLAGSAWQVGPNRDRLIRRVDPTATASFGDASSPNDVASAELGEAWTAAYARNPDASDAWDHSIKAVEAILIPIVIPKNAKATLADVIGTLNSQGLSWQLALQGQDRSASVAPLVSMLRLMWTNPDRHGSANSRKPSLVEAKAVVHLAVTVVQWARSGVLSKRLRPLRSLVFLHHRSRDAPTLVDLLTLCSGPGAHSGCVGALPRASCLTRRAGRFACVLDVLA
jgi:hypothetical protein